MNNGKPQRDFKWYKKSKKMILGGCENRSLVLIKYSIMSLSFLFLFLNGQNGFAKDLNRDSSQLLLGQSGIQHG